ncbi:MAG TPA: protocatechuate 3,4-dioxygenase subunit alpha [Candidatus Dormibacteraeota bacterium]|nr:protocatechuate 3,4-dioxygenase subunit alpha [Candidatus Dormibacteraeota bacterium]
MTAPTPSQTVGPFFGFALPFENDANAVENDAYATAGESTDAIRVEGQVLDGIGEPVGDALVEASQGDQFARCRTDGEGTFHFVLRNPVVSDGAPFFNITVFARGLLRHLQTRMYFPDGDGANHVDRVLQLVDESRRHTLIARRDGDILHFDIRLQGEGETVFFAV